MQTIRHTTSEEQRKQLRKIKTVSDSVKAIVYGGNKAGAEMAVQFNKDVRLYGMWEALLYVEQYESQEQYKPGTASRAVNAALTLESEGEE